MPLTTEQAALLKTELGKPAYSGKTDAECAALLNTPTTVEGGPATRSVPLAEIQAMGYRLGIIPRLDAALEGPVKVLHVQGGSG